MFDLERFMKIPGMATLVSLLIGFGIAALFRPLCKGPECVVLRGPPVAEIRGTVYQFGAKCVEFVPKPEECPKPKNPFSQSPVKVVETVSFADYSD